MSVLVVGSLALDVVETPFGGIENALGGSATFFSASASFFTQVKVIATVGEDFPDGHLEFLKSRGVDLKGVKKVQGKTFRWHGRYSYDLGEAETISTELNVFEKFQPRLSKNYKQAEYLFLANIDPELQLSVLEQVESPKFTACDTMNFWIEKKPEVLREVLKKVDVLTINESEARELAKEPNIVKAARIIRSMGPKVLLIKRGEYGVLKFTDKGIFWAPAYPLEGVIDPTGAGDSFAGGFMGYVGKSGISGFSDLKRAVIYGSTMASFVVEDFSINRIRTLRGGEIEARFKAFLKLPYIE